MSRVIGIHLIASVAYRRLVSRVVRVLDVCSLVPGRATATSTFSHDASSFLFRCPPFHVACGYPLNLIETLLAFPPAGTTSTTPCVSIQRSRLL